MVSCVRSAQAEIRHRAPVRRARARDVRYYCVYAQHRAPRTSPVGSRNQLRKRTPLTRIKMPRRSAPAKRLHPHICSSSRRQFKLLTISLPPLRALLRPLSNPRLSDTHRCSAWVHDGRLGPIASSSPIAPAHRPNYTNRGHTTRPRRRDGGTHTIGAPHTLAHTRTHTHTHTD